MILSVGGKGACALVNPMPELERLKEQIAYLKLLQGIAVVTFISLVGWVISASSTAAPMTMALAIIGVVLLGGAIVALHRQIGRRIDEIGRL